MAFPAAKEAPAQPQRRQKPQYYACETCSAPLVKQWVTRDGGKVRNPEDDTNHCLKCSGLIEVSKIPVPVDWRLLYGLGVVTWPVLVYGAPLLWRLAFK